MERLAGLAMLAWSLAGSFSCYVRILYVDEDNITLHYMLTVYVIVYYIVYYIMIL